MIKQLLKSFLTLAIMCVIIVRGKTLPGILYNASDPIVLLDYKNYESSIKDLRTAWFVEYYVHWCGHCQRFAPEMKAFARDVKGWSDIVKVAAINCAYPHNWWPCNGISGYPTIKYFSSFESTGKILNITDDTLREEVRQRLVEELQKDQQQGAGSNWPDITPYSGDGSEDWSKVLPESVSYQLFLFEGSNSYLGTEVILDLHKMTSLQIRRVTNDNEALQRKYDITTFPSLIAVSREGTVERVKLESTRQSIIEAIKDFMRSHGLNAELSEPTEPSIPVEDDSEDSPAESDYPEFFQPMGQDGLFKADLEKAIKYSLTQEISRTGDFTTEQLQALVTYIDVLAKYFPLKNDSAFLSRLHETVANETRLTGEIFRNIMTNLQQDSSPSFMKDQGWIGCRGSNPSFRGYPCGLWTLFHTLTVSYSIQLGHPRTLECPSVILNAMYGYIKNFFSCSDCVNNFVRMAHRRNYSQAMTPDKAILWLWQAHNEVNNRLSGDSTEDPAFPKIQYPSLDHCKDCRCSNNQYWRSSKVLKYLLDKYRNIVLL